MPQIGPLEILVVGVIALIVFGPKRLPELARSMGRALAEFRRQAGELRAEFSAGIDDVDEGAVDTSNPAPTEEAPVSDPDSQPPAPSGG